MRLAYLHELRLWVEHAGAHGGVGVVEADHVKNDGFRNRQDEGENPNGHDLHDGEQRDADSLHSAPRCYSPVPVQLQHFLHIIM